MKPTGFDGKVPLPVVAVFEDVKFNKFKKNCCQALVGRLVLLSKKGDCGYGCNCDVFFVIVNFHPHLILNWLKQLQH